MPNATIEGHDCTLFYDYDCYQNGVLKKLSPNGKIEWLERRMNMIFLEPMKTLTDRNSDIFKALEHPGRPSTAMLMVVSLLLNGMEALGSFLTENDEGLPNKNYLRFDAFVKRYLTNWTMNVTTKQHGTKQLSDILWKSYRNGLAHSFAILNAGIEPDANGGTHHINSDVIQIDAWKLFDDLQNGITQLFKDVRADPVAQKKFLRRFNIVYSC